MKILTLLYGILLLSFFECDAQKEIILRYIDFQYVSNKNSSFVNREMIFVTMDNDTLRMNVRLPFNVLTREVIDRGVYYNCHLKKDTIYTIALKKICVSDILDVPNSYYRTNTIPKENDCSKFTEIEINTNYEYNGNYGKYVDINNVLYKIIGLTPSTDCFFQH